MLGMLEQVIILIVFVDVFLTLSRKNFKFVKFAAIHLRLLRLGKVLQVTEYSECTACGTPGDSMRDSVLRQRRAASLSTGMPEYLSPSAAEDG